MYQSRLVIFSVLYSLQRNAGMLLVFLLALSAVKGNESSDQDGLRKPRQLDLGLQDIRGVDELQTTVGPPISLSNGLVNGYLPPISSPSSSEVISAQSQQAFDFKSVNSVEKESELCKYPFDNEACNSKGSSVSDSKIPTPSRDLIPPLKDVEQELTFKTATVVEQPNKQITTTTRPQKSFSSTTEKPVTKFFKHEPNRKFTKIKATTLRSRVVGSKAEATNELRSYLPPQPEFSAAAQTNIAVVQPGNRNNDQNSDHHHHDHHGDNFNICTDAFHSFLCAPLKARKRITGALPTRLLGESSFINYQKTLANFDKETASSDGFKNEYLPPKSFSSNLIQSTYLPPFSTNTPSVTIFSLPTARPSPPSKLFLEPSNFKDNFNLSPNIVSKNPFPAKLGSLNADYSTTKFATAPTLTANPTTSPTISPITDSTISSTTAPTISSTIALTTVPTISTPSTTASSTVSTIYPSTTPNILSTTVLTSAPTTSSSTIANTISTKAPTIISTTSPIATSVSTQASSVFSKTSPAIVSDSFFQSVPTAQSTFNSDFSTVPIFNALSSNENRYLPPSLSPQSSGSFVSNSRNLPSITSTVLPSSSSFPSFPPATFGAFPTNSIIPSQKPKVLPTLPAFTSTSSSSVPIPKSLIPISSFGSQLLNPENSYLPPITQFSPSFRPSSTTIKPYPSTSKPVGQPSNSDITYLPPENKVPAEAQISSSALPAPQINNPFHHGRDLCTDPFHSFLCASAKPRKKITGELPLGFKPESSNTDELRVKSEQSGQNENKIRPNQSLVGAPAQNSGYKYAKPLNSLPSNVVPPSAPSLTDYSYSKPDKTFSSPSQQAIRLSSTTSTRKPEPIYRSSEAKTISGYEYPKPDKIFSSPGGQESTKVATTTNSPSTGYTYPRPQKPFPLPTEQSEVRQKPKQKTLTSSPSNIPLPTDQARSYQYPKPDQSLNLPEKKGYSYPKPEKKLELPGESRSKSLLPQSSSNSNGFGNLESADFIPVNKVEFKRAESSKLLEGLRKFGERMKKRERQSQLLKRQSH